MLVDVGTQNDPDNTPPSLDYSFSSDCSKYVFSECSQGSWTIEVKAKDTESGKTFFKKEYSQNLSINEIYYQHIIFGH